MQSLVFEAKIGDRIIADGWVRHVVARPQLQGRSEAMRYVEYEPGEGFRLLFMGRGVREWLDDLDEQDEDVEEEGFTKGRFEDEAPPSERVRLV